MSGSAKGQRPESAGHADAGLLRPRVLGDAWAGWDASQGAGESIRRAGPFLFVLFHALVVLTLVLAWSLLVWLALPRGAQFGIGAVGARIAWAAGAALLLLPALLLCLRVCGLSLPAVIARPLRAWVFLLWPPCASAARTFGVSSDRIAHAFLLVANRLAGSRRKTDGEGVLVLAPRCLRPDLMSELRALAGRSGARIAIVTGGEEARAAIFRAPPAGVLAIACERDLVAGVRELAGRFLVLSLANRRPEGPCRNSEIDLEEAGRMIAQLSSPR